MDQTRRDEAKTKTEAAAEENLSSRFGVFEGIRNPMQWVYPAATGERTMIRVMLVDDEENAMDVLEILPGEIGPFEIVGRFTNPLEAVRAFKPAVCDAVFLDIDMSGLSGMELARMFRDIDPGIEVVFTTAYSQYAIEAFDLGSTDYLLKPIRKDRLEKAVSRIKKAGTAASPGGTGKPAVTCMGGFAITGGGEDRPVSWRTNKERELCALLVHHGGQFVDQSYIIETLWPDSGPDTARMYMYTCVSYMRRTFETHNLPFSLLRNGSGYRLSLGGVRPDVAELEELLERTMRGEGLSPHRLDRINALYAGEYLQFCDYEWAIPKRRMLEGHYVRALRVYSGYFRERGMDAAAADCLGRILQLAPDSEADGRELMRLHMRAGNRAEAVRTYRMLERSVRELLDLEPEPETTALYREITAMQGGTGNAD